MLRAEGERAEESSRGRRERDQHSDRRPQRPGLRAAAGVDEVVGVAGHEGRLGWGRGRCRRQGWGWRHCVAREASKRVGQGHRRAKTGSRRVEGESKKIQRGSEANKVNAVKKSKERQREAKAEKVKYIQIQT